MGRVSFSDAEHYGGGSGGSFFSLKNDKDVARVRFMLNGADDLDNLTYTVHRVSLGDKYRNVSCLRSYNEPVSKCPFCEEFANVQAKFYIPLYNIDEGEVQIWERGKNFAAKLSSIVSRYSAKSPLVNHIFEIERNGAKGDMKTTYEVYEVDKDETTLDDLPEIPEILGKVYLLDKSFDDMNYYVEEGDFPPDEDDEPIQRRGRGSDEEDEIMNPPEDEEEVPFEEEKSRRTRGNKESSGRMSNTRTASRRTPTNGGSDGSSGRRRAF